jgi:dTDP-4-dehydrorhamnose 3,5-epimerase
MQYVKQKIEDVILFEPDVYGDERGYFFESFNHKKFESIVNRKVEFCQDNHSCSQKGVLRGLHYQDAPHQQGKLVRVIAGEVFDVAVDIRPQSKTYGYWVGVYLSAINKKQLWIPEGFAHGFLSLSNNTEVLYKATSYYDPQSEKCISWNDKTLNIEWPKIDEFFTISAKDKLGMYL